MSDHDRPLDRSDSPSLSRRAFIGRLGALGAAGLGATSLLSACGGDDARVGPDGVAIVDSSTCEGYDAIEPAGLQTRQSLNYVDATEMEGKNCANCRFYNVPEGGSPCGGCQLFPGPVSPGGWCQSWVAQVT